MKRTPQELEEEKMRVSEYMHATAVCFKLLRQRQYHCFVNMAYADRSVPNFPNVSNQKNGRRHPVSTDLAGYVELSSGDDFISSTRW